MVRLEHELAHIKGIDKRFLSRLSQLGIVTVKDLLWHFPSRYDDFSRLSAIGDLQVNQVATVRGVVSDVSVRQSWKRRMFVIEVLISDETGSIKGVWFNQPYLSKMFRVGQSVCFAGKVSASRDDIIFSNPLYEFSESNQTDEHQPRGLVSVYPETKGLTSRGLRYLVALILKNLAPLDESIPDEVLKKNNFPHIREALEELHCPSSFEQARASMERFAFEDLFLLQLNNVQLRSQLAREKAIPLLVQDEDIEALKKVIPFVMTQSQQRSLEEITSDIQQPHPMNRLLQGDVGSGKTIVAAIVALLAARRGTQVVFMAPTEVLARQHYQTIRSLFSHIVGTWKLNVCILTGNESRCFFDADLETKKKKSELIHDIGEGRISIIIGTHAVIQKNVSFKNLALAIIDEQHRFGVKQRATLASGSAFTSTKKESIVPHFLSMSATPIPRTLSMTLFGDLDLSTIDELPQGRRPITTKVVPPEKRRDAYEFIRAEINKGRQVFVICPRIEASEIDADIPQGQLSIQQMIWNGARAVQDEYEKLSKIIFPEFTVAMLHGRMKPDEKNEVMRKFSANEVRLLVSTSVVEIGVDIPNATIMMIEGADRFGLAQLYQFRGRVGRGKHQSYCFLFTDSTSESVHERLKCITEAKNGFELAEKDLALRGPGQFLGSSQTGLPDLAMRSLDNIELLRRSRLAADFVMEKSPTLRLYPLLKERLNAFRRDIHLE